MQIPPSYGPGEMKTPPQNPDEHEPPVVVHVAQKTLPNLTQKPRSYGESLLYLIAEDHRNSRDPEYEQKYNKIKSSINGKEEEYRFLLSGIPHSKIAFRDFAMGATPITGNILDTNTLKKFDQIQSGDYNLSGKETKEQFNLSIFNQFYHAVVNKGVFKDPLSATNIILTALSQEQTAIFSPLQAYYDKYGVPSANSRVTTEVYISDQNVVIRVVDLLEYPVDKEDPNAELHPDKVMQSTTTIKIPIHEFNKLDSTYGGEHCNVRFRFNQDIKVGRRRDTLLKPMKAAVGALSDITSKTVKALFPTPVQTPPAFQAPEPPPQQVPSLPATESEPSLAHPEKHQDPTVVIHVPKTTPEPTPPEPTPDNSVVMHIPHTPSHPKGSKPS